MSRRDVLLMERALPPVERVFHIEGGVCWGGGGVRMSSGEGKNSRTASTLSIEGEKLSIEKNAQGRVSSWAPLRARAGSFPL